MDKYINYFYNLLKENKISEKTTNDEIITGRGHSTLKDAKHHIEARTKAAISDAILQVGDGCLANQSTIDNSAHILKKETVFYVDTNALANSGNPALAEVLNTQQLKLLNSRRESNSKFESALSGLDVNMQDKAVRAMNYIKEKIYYDTYNDYHQHAVNSPNSTKNTLAEFKISEAKLMLAEQIENGSFASRVNGVEKNSHQIKCEGNDIVR